MHLLGLEELLDLHGDGVVRVVGDVRARLVGGRGGAGALPTTDVDRLPQQVNTKRAKTLEKTNYFGGDEKIV